MNENKSFNGWWNCFESFADELFAVDAYADGVCTRVLEGAGVTKDEAAAWLTKTECPNQKVIDVVRQYCENLEK